MTLTYQTKQTKSEVTSMSQLFGHMIAGPQRKYPSRMAYLHNHKKIGTSISKIILLIF